LGLLSTLPADLICFSRIPRASLTNSVRASRSASVVRWRKSALLAALIVFMAAIGFPSPVFGSGTAYYINNRSDSNCSDGGPHSIAQPWCTFSPANKVKTFSAGDQVLLARGARWNQQLTLAGRGSASEPITLGAYGTGPNPKILRNQAVSDLCVLVTDGSFWKISDLEVGRASVGLMLHYTQLFNQEMNISHIYAHDNKGIWGGYSPEYPVHRKVPDPFASSLNINLSSGILFNIASYLTFSSSQYVLKGVTLSDVRGANNVDSVAFDAETNTIDNQDGHNAFQDVVMNGLVFASDNGHAAAIYQRAGLGCSDALRLLGMTNVTLINSVLFEEAGCPTSTGTAAVILGRVNKVRFVNNIFFGVPHTGSPDETAIDLEWSESEIDLQGNFFAGNAGPAVEILNIHPADHSDALDFSSNTFAQNAHSHRPGAASIWEDNKGRGYGVPTGKIGNNLFFEQHGPFLAGKNIALVTNANDRQTALVANYAAELFSPMQGKNQWRYIYESSGSTWSDLPEYSATYENGAWMKSNALTSHAPTSDEPYVSAFNLMPASCSGNCTAGGVARAWVAPREGTVSIRGRVLKLHAGGGNGAQASINLVSSRGVTQVWPASGGRQLIAGGDQTGYATDLDTVHVAQGDVLRFEVHANGDNTYDEVSWTPSIGYVDPAR
jgi:hypothetical protein